MRKITGFANTLIAALLLAAASTLADLIWALWIPAHRAEFGLMHGALLFMVLGLVLGVLAARDRDSADSRPLPALAAGGELLAGLGGAAAFWAISGIWLGGSTRNPNYAVNFASWFIAFLPGFACLLLRQTDAE